MIHIDKLYNIKEISVGSGQAKFELWGVNSKGNEVKVQLTLCPYLLTAVYRTVRKAFKTHLEQSQHFLDLRKQELSQ